MDDETFLRQFESGEFPRADWHQREHVKIAYLYLRRHGYDEALARIRAGIQAYNAAHQVRDTPFAGYHETITQAWLKIVDSTIRNHGPGKSADDFCSRQPHLLSRSLLRLFYSHDRICDPRAKTTFLEPDLTALPN